MPTSAVQKAYDVFMLKISKLASPCYRPAASCLRCIGCPLPAVAWFRCDRELLQTTRGLVGVAAEPEARAWVLRVRGCDACA